MRVEDFRMSQVPILKVTERENILTRHYLRITRLNFIILILKSLLILCILAVATAQTPQSCFLPRTFRAPRDTQVTTALYIYLYILLIRANLFLSLYTPRARAYIINESHVGSPGDLAHARTPRAKKGASRRERGLLSAQGAWMHLEECVYVHRVYSFNPSDARPRQVSRERASGLLGCAREKSGVSLLFGWI